MGLTQEQKLIEARKLKKFEKLAEKAAFNLAKGRSVSVVLRELFLDMRKSLDNTPRSMNIEQAIIDSSINSQLRNVSYHIHRAAGVATMDTYKGEQLLRSFSVPTRNNRTDAPKDQGKIRFFDTGRQDDESVATKRGYSVGIDTGWAKTEKQLQQYFKKDEFYPLDLLITSHFHLDHFGNNAIFVREQLSTFFAMADAKVYIQATMILLKTFAKYIEPSQAVILGSGSENMCKFYVGKDKPDFKKPDCEYMGLVIETLGPLEAAKGDSYKDINRTSIITKITCQNSTVLYMGDAPLDAQLKALEAYAKKHGEDSLKCDVIKLSHHGAEDCINEKILELVKPKACIVCCAHDELHPGKETLKLVESKGIDIYRTARSGYIDVCFGPDGIKIEEQYPTYKELQYTDNNYKNNMAAREKGIIMPDGSVHKVKAPTGSSASTKNNMQVEDIFESQTLTVGEDPAI